MRSMDVLDFTEHYGFPLSTSTLMPKIFTLVLTVIVIPCKICIENKPNLATDRGLISALPILNLVNQVLYVDFIQVDEFNSFDYVFTIVDGLSRFAQFIPCKKTITGEQAIKILYKEWIQKYGRPKEIFSENDIRFVSPEGFW